MMRPMRGSFQNQQGSGTPASIAAGSRHGEGVYQQDASASLNLEDEHSLNVYSSVSTGCEQSLPTAVNTPDLPEVVNSKLKFPAISPFVLESPSDASLENNISPSCDMPWDPGFRGRYDVSEEVYNFYCCFQDVTVQLYGHYTRPVGATAGSHPQIDPLAQFCLSKRLSQPQEQAQYNLLKDILNCAIDNRSADPPILFQQYPTAKAFSDRITLEWRLLLKEQKWHEARIILTGEKQVGFFIPLFEAIEMLLQKHNGREHLSMFKLKRNEDGERIYFHPTNCDGMRLDDDISSATFDKRTPVYLSIYCDGTEVANYGSTECSVVRMRIDNLDTPLSMNEWTDVGIAPTLILKKSSPSRAQLTELRLQLFQIFMFLLLESCSRHSATDFDRHGIEVRVLSIVTKRPQERSTLALHKAVRSIRLCSLCRMRIDRNNTGNPDPRSVVELVPAQLKLAILERIQNPEELVVPSVFWLQCDRWSKEDLVARKEYLRRYLQLESAKAFPPALSIIPGLGSKPYRLFHIPGFDRLHVLDLGVSRLFADSLHRIFQDVMVRGQKSKAELIRLANGRCSDLPSTSLLSGTRPFISAADEKQAIFTGKQRRMLTPYLPVIVLGLNQTSILDEDEVLQTALAIDFLQCLMNDTNMSHDFLQLTNSDIGAIEAYSRKAVTAILNTCQCKMTSKLHRLGWHIGESLRNFGPMLFADTSFNETLHKGIKKSYLATNKKKGELGKQILNINIAADLTSRSSLQHSQSNAGMVMTAEKELSEPESESLRPSLQPLFGTEILKQTNIALQFK